MPAIVGQLEALKAETFVRLLTPSTEFRVSAEVRPPDADDHLINVDETAKMLGIK